MSLLYSTKKEKREVIKSLSPTKCPPLLAEDGQVDSCKKQRTFYSTFPDREMTFLKKLLYFSAIFLVS